MNTQFFDEIQKLGHDDDQRYRLLMMGLRRIYEEKRNLGLIRRLERKWRLKKRSVEAGSWK
ncbi:hypothetical protein [Paenibacillus sp. y28]|uniref:hypothetical protein n=1 Tax=Paenibacillus sp. y28 TaxID=3129110 RepID=UPI0030178197